MAATSPIGNPDRGRPSLAPLQIRVRKAPPPRKRRDLGLWMTIFSLLVTIAAGLSWLWWQSSGRRLRATPGRAAPAAGATRDRPPPAVPQAAEQATLPARLPEADASVPPPDSKTSVPLSRSPPSPAPASPSPTPATAPIEPVAPPAAEPEVQAAEPVDLQAVNAALAPVIGLLAAQDFDGADAAIEAAGNAGGIRQRLAPWRAVAASSRAFADYSQEALQATQPGHEYTVAGRTIAIVENERTFFIYRSQGRNKKIGRDQIPEPIRLAIVLDWFNDQPANQIYIGAYRATRNPPELAEARTCWEAARAAGFDVDRLLEWLDDPLVQARPPAEAGSSSPSSGD